MYKFSLLYSFLFMLNKNVAIMLVIINLGHLLQVGLLSGKRACSGFFVGVNELTSRPLKLTSHSIGT